MVALRPHGNLKDRTRGAETNVEVKWKQGLTYTDEKMFGRTVVDLPGAAHFRAWSLGLRLNVVEGLGLRPLFYVPLVRVFQFLLRVLDPKP